MSVFVIVPTSHSWRFTSEFNILVQDFRADFPQVGLILGSCFEDFEQNLEKNVFGTFWCMGDLEIISQLGPLVKDKIKWLHTCSAGIDMVRPKILEGGYDLAKVTVTNAKGCFSDSLAEYVLTAMLHFNKQIPTLQKNKTQKSWEPFVMNTLSDKTVGFVGFGDIAKHSAVLCKKIKMNVYIFISLRFCHSA